MDIVPVRTPGPVHSSTDAGMSQDLPVRVYTEKDIQQVKNYLRTTGQYEWSAVPRFYIILTDIGQIDENCQPQLIDKLNELEINDTWLPIISEYILDKILPRDLHVPFCRSQLSVCTSPTEFRIDGGMVTHGHFANEVDAPFQSRRIIGEGHIGTVDEVSSSATQQLYARKSIRRESVFREKVFKRIKDHLRNFNSELQALGRIDHEHCVKIIGSYTTPRHLAIIISPVADCNLDEYLSHVETSLDSAASFRIRGWFGCLATAVQYLHAKQIRHRDIKPANILVHGTNVLLVDFELAFDWEDLAHSTTSMDSGCTRMYAAPEVILNNKRNSTSDTWSLGCVFLEMATVVNRRRVSEMRDYFVNQSDNSCFYNNKEGITQWISILAEVSGVESGPLLWVPKMLQHDRKLRLRAAEVTGMIRRHVTKPRQANIYFGTCCQPTSVEIAPSTCLQEVNKSKTVGKCSTKLSTRREKQAFKFQYCSRCGSKKSLKPGTQCQCCDPFSLTQMSRRLLAGNKGIQVRILSSLFYPPTVYGHLTKASMDNFTRLVVAQNNWGSVISTVKFSCLPGLNGRKVLPSVRVHVRNFEPACHLVTLQKTSLSTTVNKRDSLTIGIYEANPALIMANFDAYLSNMVDNHLMEYSSILLNLYKYNHSSQVVYNIFKWFQTCKADLPVHDRLSMQNAIKLLGSNTALEHGLTLEQMPDSIRDIPFHGHGPERPYGPTNQSPRLLNRQVKVAFFMLQKSLLEQVLNNLLQLLLKPSPWAASVFVSICLAFLLERIEVTSRLFIFRAPDAQIIDLEQPGTISDIEGYCLQVENVVFGQLYQMLSTKIRSGRCITDTKSSHLASILSEMRQDFEIQEPQDSQEFSRYGDSSRLTSILLDLLEHI